MGHIRTNVPLPTVWPPPTDHASVAAALRYGRLRDPIGQHVHLALAMLYLLMLPLLTAPKDWAWGILLGWTIIRLPHIWPCYAALLRDRLMWLLVAWTAWHGLSIIWSADQMAGLDELGAFRVILTPLLLWPVLDRAPWLVGAFLAGVFGQNLVQLAQQFHWFGQKPGYGGRLDGWLHAIQAGAVCAAAICWHLSAALHGRGWLRWGSLLGIAIAAGGLIYSGSRGPWLAAAIAVPLGLVVIGIRRPRARRGALVLAVIGLLGAAAAWPFAKDVVSSRVNQAIADIHAAADGDYDSDVGQRLARWSAAWVVFTDSPITGTGAGGYGKAIDKLGYGELSPPGHHAHSVYLHELATTGGPGALIVLAVVLLSIWRSFKDRPDHPYADGTLFVLVSWLIGGIFDAYHLNGHMFGLLVLAVALTLPYRAAIRSDLTADNSTESHDP